MGVAAVVGGAAIVGAVSSNVAANKAASATNKASNAAIKSTEAATKQARGDLFNLFPSAQAAGQQGFQGAIDVFNQSVPAQQQAFQGGNVAAQQQILAGLPQIQNALFGNQVDLSGLQAYQAPQQDLSFLNQQLPFTQNQSSGAVNAPSANIYNQMQNPVTPEVTGQQNAINQINDFMAQMERQKANELIYSEPGADYSHNNDNWSGF